ncbi:MAG: phage portal protein [Cetobacterium sp.]
MIKILENVKDYLIRKLGGVSGLSVLIGCDESGIQDHAKDPFNNPSFALAIQKRVEATKMVELGIFRGEGDTKVEDKKNYLMPLIETPNPNQSYGDFVELILKWSLGKDNGVLIEKVTGLPSMAPDLIIYNPDNFTVYFDNYRINKITISNPAKVITGDDLKNFLWIKSPNCYNDVGGINPGTTGTGRSTQKSMAVIGSYIKKIWTWNWALAANSGKAGGIITPKDTAYLSDEDRQEIADKYSAMTTGMNNGKPVVLGGAVQYHDTSKAPTDADWREGEKTSHMRICLSVGVPPELVGEGESTYNNRKEAKKELYTDTIIPWYNDFLRQLNKLLEKELKGSYFDIKIGSIEALKEDKGEELKALDTLKDRLTINEYRKAAARITGLDLDDVEGGDVIIIGNETLANLSVDLKGDGKESEGDI